MTHTQSTLNSTAQAGAHAAADDRELTVTEDGRVLNDPTHAQAVGHGNTSGGWIMAALVVVGFAVGCIGLLTTADIVVWIGAALMVIGALVGFVAAKQGDRDGRSAHDRH